MDPEIKHGITTITLTPEQCKRLAELCKAYGGSPDATPLDDTLYQLFTACYIAAVAQNHITSSHYREYEQALVQ
jgi:hypothetical protein